MPKVALTARLVDELTGIAGQARTLYLDTSRDSPQGFALRITATGKRAFYLIRSVKAKGRRPWVCLGPAEGRGLDAARRAAWARAGEMALGRDPNEDARSAKREEVRERIQRAIKSDEWRVVDMLRAYIKAKEGSLALVTYEEYKRTTAVDIEPTQLGGMLATDVVRDDVRRFLGPIASRAPSVAGRALTFLRSAFRWAMDEEVIVPLPDGGKQRRPRAERDPTRRAEDDFPLVKKAMRPERKRVLADKEIVKLWRGLDELEPCWSAFARVILLCGTRRGETYKAPWANMKLDARDEHEGAEWFIPASHRKGRMHGRDARRALTVPLAPLAVRLIRELVPITGHRDRVFVGQGIYIGGAGGEIKRVSGIKDITIHDLRRTCSTGLQRLGAPPHVISVVLGHSREAGALQTDATYTQDRRAGEHRLWLEKWASHIEGLIA